MNILDTIINGESNDANINPTNPNPAPVATPTPAAPTMTMAGAHDFNKGHLLSYEQVATLRHRINNTAMADGVAAYRGRGVSVQSLNNDPSLIANAAGLSWKTVPIQLAMRGNTETRDIEGMRALVRSDTGAFLAVASDKYKPHQNSDLLGLMSSWASDNGLAVTRVGQWDGGKRIWAVAASDIQSEVRVGDTFALQMVIRGGHEPGVATTVKAVAMRLICSNGAWVSNGIFNVRWTHNAGLSRSRMASASASLAKWSGAFDRYMEDMAKLYAVPLPKLAARVFLADVIQPELIVEIARQLHIERRNDLRLGVDIVARMLDSDRTARLVSGILTTEAGRLLRAVTQATSSQVGGSHTEGTLAHAYNGVTYYNSHLRGRDADAALESQLYGEGGRMAQAARAVGLEYVQALAPQVARQ